VHFSCFTLLNTFSTVPRVSGPLLMFCTSRPVFGGIEGARSTFRVLRAWTHFHRYRGCPVQFSYFALLDSCLDVLRALGPVFIFALQESFWAEPRTPCALSMFCAPSLFLGGTEGAGCTFHVFRYQTHFRRY
jgi:hypothetical protein